MKTSDQKAEFTSRLSTLLSGSDAGSLETSSAFGNFHCSIETFNDFSITRRDFETTEDCFAVPFVGKEPVLQMIFSLEGKSVFNERSKPYILPAARHCMNFFNYFECKNLLDPKSHQHDISFRLGKDFYSDILIGDLSSMNDRLPGMILRQKDFNTINDGLPADSAIAGILNNIVQCPFSGEMREVFIRQHLRALFTLQVFHFGQIISGKEARLPDRMSRRDEEILHEVKSFIDQNFLEPSSLDSLARRFGVNEFKLKYGFKKLFNTSTIRYLQDKRLEFSRTLLRETDRPIGEIARETGYTHAGNFTTAFTKAFGKSPHQFRSRKAG